MLPKTIPLREGSAATLTTYIHGRSSQGEFQIPSRPGIIVMTGGPVPLCVNWLNKLFGIESV